MVDHAYSLAEMAVTLPKFGPSLRWGCKPKPPKIPSRSCTASEVIKAKICTFFSGRQKHNARAGVKRFSNRRAIDVQIKNENLRAIPTLNRLLDSLKHYLRSYSFGSSAARACATYPQPVQTMSLTLKKLQGGGGRRWVYPQKVRCALGASSDATHATHDFTILGYTRRRSPLLTTQYSSCNMATRCLVDIQRGSCGALDGEFGSTRASA